MRFNSRCAPHRQPGVTGQRTQSQATALVIAMGLLLMAGLAQELFLLAREPGPGVLGSIAAPAGVAWPWPPPLSRPGIFRLRLGLEPLLAASWLCDQTSLAARIGMGLALGGALLAHPGTVGYVVGLGAVWLYRHRAGMLPGAAGMGLALLSGAPWIAAVSGDTGLQTLVTNSIPAVAATSPYLWAVSRLLLVAHTFFPAPIATTDRLWASLVLTFFILSLPGALVTALLSARIPPPPSPLLIFILTGAAIGTAIYNAAGAYLTGILDAYYPGVLILLVFVATTLDAPGVRRMFVAAFFLGGCFVTLLLLLSTFPLSGDSNVTYRSQYATIFFVQRWGLLPGLAILAAAAVINVRTVFRDWRAAGFGTGTA